MIQVSWLTGDRRSADDEEEPVADDEDDDEDKDKVRFLCHCR